MKNVVLIETILLLFEGANNFTIGDFLKYKIVEDKKGSLGSRRTVGVRKPIGVGHVVIGAGGINPISVEFPRNNHSSNEASMTLGQYENVAKVAAAAYDNGCNGVRFHRPIPKEPIKAVLVKPEARLKNPQKTRQQTKPKDISLREFVIGLILVFILLRFFLTYVLFGIAVCFFLKVSVSDVISKVRKVLDR